jgi:hypothetical protein
MLTLFRRARCMSFLGESHRERKGKDETSGTDEFRRPLFAQLQHKHCLTASGSSESIDTTIGTNVLIESNGLGSMWDVASQMHVHHARQRRVGEVTEVRGAECTLQDLSPTICPY